MRIATPMRSQRKFFGNQDTEHLFDQALETAENVHAGIEAVDFTVFLEINDLMFFGPFLAERDVAVGDFLRAHPEAGEKVVRDLILGSGSQTAAAMRTVRFIGLRRPGGGSNRSGGNSTRYSYRQ